MRTKTLLLITIILLSPSLCWSYGDHQTLQINMPKASGTGAPAIPSTHRSFYAYPGVEYKIRAQATGGLYPYTFTLSNAPEGMSVDSDGYIRWPNPTTSAANIVLRATASNAAYVESAWSIVVQTSGFKFVDCSSETNGSGTLASPFNSIANMISGSDATDIVYFREGSCELPSRGAGPASANGDAIAFDIDDPTYSPVIWMAYPGESVTIDLGGDKYFHDANASVPSYFEGLRFYNGREYFFSQISSSNYHTFLDCTFDTLTNSRPNYNDNQGGYYTYSSGTGYFLTFQGCTFTNFTAAQGIGSIYNQSQMTIEDNTFTSFAVSGSIFRQILALKIGIQNLTLRGNSISVGAGGFGIFGGSTNGMFADGTSYGHGPISENNEICFNYFNGTVEYNRYGDQGEFWMYRNTFVSTVQMTNVDGSACDGPWTFENNVFQNTAEGLTWHYTCSGAYESCVTQTSNLAGTTGLVDASGLLVNRDYVGTYGWETTTTPTISAPSGFRTGGGSTWK